MLHVQSTKMEVSIDRNSFLVLYYILYSSFMFSSLLMLEVCVTTLTLHMSPHLIERLQSLGGSCHDWTDSLPVEAITSDV